MEVSAKGFPRRLHPDGSLTSICPRCFCTVGRHKTRNELDAEEERHVCVRPDLEALRLAKEKLQRDL